ncbi:MAG: LPS export ABC transporter permease LptF [Pseudomonadota bacterium]|nr:LPS export ABC transporter permease LptF [Pseudomonadota bacterium]
MILRRALAREVLLTSFAVTAVIFCIFVVVRVLGFLRQAAEGIIPVDSIFVLLFLKVIAYMDVILPLMMFVAMLLVLGRWSRQNELTIMAASGLGLSHLLRPVVFLILVGALIVGSFSMVVGPMAVRSVGAIEHELKSRTDIVGVSPGVFMETQAGRAVYFVEQLNKENGRDEGIFGWGSDAGREGVVLAQSAHRHTDPEKGQVFLVLENGVRYEGAPGDSVYRVINFERYTLRDRSMMAAPVKYPLHGWETTRLWRSGGPHEQKEIAWRISKIVVLPILMMYALGLGRVAPRSNRYVSMFSALIVYFTYTNLVTMACARIPNGGASAVTLLVVVHLGFALGAGYLLWRRSRDEPLWFWARPRERTV